MPIAVHVLNPQWPMTFEITRDRPGLAGGRNIVATNGHIEIGIALDFGPRVLHCAAPGGPNVFGVIDPKGQRVDTAFGEPWHIYGGHRLWAAPEDAIRSYVPDNSPVSAHTDRTAGCLTVMQEPQHDSGMQKTIRLRLDDSAARVFVEHEIVNRASVAVELAPWALTVMAPGGHAILPQPAFVPHPRALAPARPLVMWPFTDMTDARWTWGRRSIVLRQEVTGRGPQKIGLYDRAGWLAYDLGHHMFIKRHEPMRAIHADFGCNVEVFTDDTILELETLGPLVTLSPGASVVHRETWELWTDLDGADAPTSREAWLHAHFPPTAKADT